uniref:Uncharacterized protein n=1 Tax=Accipiter nisus TaxID=211598 RepID=A0A8B9MWQ9_9AVES
MTGSRMKPSLRLATARCEGEGQQSSSAHTRTPCKDAAQAGRPIRGREGPGCLTPPLWRCLCPGIISTSLKKMSPNSSVPKQRRFILLGWWLKQIRGSSLHRFPSLLR